MSGTIFKRIPILMSVVFMILITVTVYRNTNDLEHIKSLTALLKLQPEQREVKIQTAAVPIAQPTSSRTYLIPDDDHLQGLSETQLQQIYWNYINTLQVLCRNQTRLGSFKDGGKEVCIDDAYKPKAPCLVYSFGSNNQFDFETAVISRFQCDVHTFDPTMTAPGKRVNVPPKVTFHEAGLWNKDMKNEKGWQMNTLSTLVKNLNHEQSVIDILKIDVEGGEWYSFPSIFESGILKRVKQLCIEVHYGVKWTKSADVDTRAQLRVLRGFYEHGFHIFMHERNLYEVIGPMVLVNEISLINVNFFNNRR